MPAIVTRVLTVGAIVAGKYRIESILGMGGMGVVAVATHVQLDQKFALKVVHDAMAEDRSIVERFMREARASAKLKSEHVCRVSDVDQLETGAPFIVMELLDGSDLQKVLQAALLPIETAANYVLQACIAIAEAHGVGIIHRDLKPANLFLTTRMDGTPLIKVLDFGIAKATADAELKITQTQAIMGSPGYMSPEQLRSARDVDGRSDIWSLGVILYELTTGRLPFTGQTITELAVKVAVDPPAPLPATMNPRFAAIISRCLEKDVDRRYPSVTALANDLAPFAGATGTHSASLIARLSASQPGVSAPRSAVLPQQATQLTGFAGTAQLPSGNAPTAITPPVRRRSKKPLVIAGALVLLAGAAFGGYMLTRKTEGHPAKRPPHADAGIALDADTGFEARELENLKKNKRWQAIIDQEKAGDDPVLKVAVADARASYSAELLARIESLVKLGDCAHANGVATGAKSYVDTAPLVAAAEKCVEKKPVSSGSGSGSGSATHVGSGSGSGAHAGSGSATSPPPSSHLTSLEMRAIVDDAENALSAGRYAEALAQAKRVLADSAHNHVNAARIAAIASCQLGKGADAQKYLDKIPKFGAPMIRARKRILSSCEDRKIVLE